MDDATYDRIVAHIYRAAAGEVGWEDALEQMRAGFGTRRMFAAPIDMQRLIDTGLHRGPATAAQSMLRHATDTGLLGDDGESKVARLRSHVETALAAYAAMRSVALKALAAHPLMSNFAFPIWLVDAGRRVHFMNAAAQRAKSGPLVKSGAALRLVCEPEDRELGTRPGGLASAASGADALVRLSRNRPRHPAWLHLSTLVPEQVLGRFGAQRLILAVLFEHGAGNVLDDQALARAFGLTPAEARVAARLAEGLSPTAIAESHGIRISTVRRQMAQLFSKVGVARQVDLVRILRQGESLWAKRVVP
jgi:DNA-binding CsgD family transcriptional regulator